MGPWKYHSHSPMILLSAAHSRLSLCDSRLYHPPFSGLKVSSHKHTACTTPSGETQTRTPTVTLLLRHCTPGVVSSASPALATSLPRHPQLLGWSAASSVCIYRNCGSCTTWDLGGDSSSSLGLQTLAPGNSWVHSPAQSRGHRDKFGHPGTGTLEAFSWGGYFKFLKMAPAPNLHSLKHHAG